jgi:hypothetical protein
MRCLLRLVLVSCLLATACVRLGLRDEPCELGRDVEAGHAEPEAAEPVPTPKKKAWEAAFGGEVAARPAVAARVAGWPRVLVADGLPADDDAFVRRLAADTWRGLAAFVDREHALPVDHVTLGATLDRAAARVGDYTNVTNVGLYLAAVAAAFRRLGILPAFRPAAVRAA